MSDNVTTDHQGLLEDVSESEIINALVLNIIRLDMDIKQKIMILFETIPDLAKVLSHLSRCKETGFIDEKTYNDLCKECLLYVRDRKYIDYNPIYFT